MNKLTKASLISEAQLKQLSTLLTRDKAQAPKIAQEHPIFLVSAQGERELSIREFAALFHITYCHDLQFASFELEKRVRAKFKKEQENKKIEKIRLWLGAYYSAQLSEGAVAPIFIRFIDEQVGYGLFASQELEKGSFIGQYTGLLMRNPYFSSTINDFSFTYPMPKVIIPPRLTINSLCYGNELRLMNHSDLPNCEAIGVFHDGIIKIVIRAIRYIAKGEQLTYDYGPDYWRRRTKLPL